MEAAFDGAFGDMEDAFYFFNRIILDIIQDDGQADLLGQAVDQLADLDAAVGSSRAAASGRVSPGSA